MGMRGRREGGEFHLELLVLWGLSKRIEGGVTPLEQILYRRYEFG